MRLMYQHHCISTGGRDSVTWGCLLFSRAIPLLDSPVPGLTCCPGDKAETRWTWPLLWEPEPHEAGLSQDGARTAEWRTLVTWGSCLLSSVGTLGREIIPQSDFVKIYQSTVRPFKSLKLKYLSLFPSSIYYLPVLPERWIRQFESCDCKGRMYEKGLIWKSSLL